MNIGRFNIDLEIFKNKKKFMIIVICIIIVVSLITFSFILLTKNVDYFVGSGNPHAEKIKNEYEKLNEEVNEDGKTYPKVVLPSDNILRYSNVKEITNVFKNNDDAVIYFGFSTCLYCRSAIQILCEIADDTKLDKIYYLDTSKVDDYGDMFKYLDKKFLTDDQKAVYSPLVIFVVDGQIVSHNKGTLFSQVDPYTELDDSQKKGLGEIYYYGIRDVLE